MCEGSQHDSPFLDSYVKAEGEGEGDVWLMRLIIFAQTMIRRQVPSNWLEEPVPMFIRKPWNISPLSSHQYCILKCRNTLRIFDLILAPHPASWNSWKCRNSCLSQLEKKVANLTRACTYHHTCYNRTHCADWYLSITFVACTDLSRGTDSNLQTLKSWLHLSFT